MTTNDYCVIGLGKFGTAVIDTLLKLSKNVLAVDTNEELVEKISNIVDYAVTLDSTDIEALEGVGVRKFENVIVCISDLEASIMTCAILKELKIPNIIAKATSERHQKVLEAIGITNIVRPELEAAKRTALRSVYRLALDLVDVDENHSITRGFLLNEKIADIPLKELDLRHKFDVNVVAIQRNFKIIVPTGNDVMKKMDIVLFISKNAHIKEFYDYLSGEVSKEQEEAIQNEVNKMSKNQIMRMRMNIKHEERASKELSIDDIKKIAKQRTGEIKNKK